MAQHKHHMKVFGFCDVHLCSKSKSSLSTEPFSWTSICEVERVGQLGRLEPYLGVLFEVIYEYKHCDNHYKLRYKPYNYGYMYVYYIMMYINSRNFTPSTELVCFRCFYGIDIWIGQVSQDSGRAFRDSHATRCFDGLLQPERRYYQLYYHKWWLNHYKWWFHGDFHGLRMG